MTDKGETTILEGEFEEAGTGSAAPAAPRPRRRLWRWMPWALVLLLASFIGGLFAAPEVEDRLIAWGLMPPPAAETAPAARPSDASADAGLRASLDSLQARLDTVESALADIGAENSALAQQLTRLDDRLAQSGGETSAMPDAVAERLSTLQSRLEALGEKVSGLASEQAGQVAPEELENLTRAIENAQQARARIESALAALERRLATLEAAGRTGSVASTLYRDLIALHRRVDAGQPYGPALQAVRLQIDTLPDVLRAGAASALASLADHAQDGAPTRQALAESFPDVARRLQQAGDAPAPEAGWFERFRRSLSSIVVVRPDGTAAGDDLPARLARAEAAVSAGQIEAARRELGSLPEETLDAAPAARRWIEDAQARLAVEAALESIFAALAPDSGGTAGDGT